MAAEDSLPFQQRREDFARKAFPPAPPHKLETLNGPAYSNIVLRGFLLQGGHPGTTTAEIANNITPLLKAGVSTFVCLQPDLPSVATQSLHARSAFGSNVVSAKPYIQQAQSIVDAGMMPQSGGAPVSFIHVPIPAINGATLPDDQLKSLVLDLLAYLRAGEMMYVQCSDGNGRSGTVCAVLAGLAYGMGPVEALALMQKSRNDRPGAQGPSPETHEQRMQVHRLLSDRAFRTAAAAVTPRHSDSAKSEADAKLDAVLKKVRGILGKKGYAALIYLRRYVARTLGGSSTFTRAAFDRLAADAEWYLTADEADSMWKAAAAGGGSRPESAVPVEAFFQLIRGPLTARRAAAVHDAFRRLSGNAGTVSLDKIAAAFNSAQHPDVKAGRRSAADITAEFLDTFGVQERTERAQVGAISRAVSVADFENYYADLSAAIADDALFELLVFGCWPNSVTGDAADGGSGGARAQRESKTNPHITAPVGARTGPAGPTSIFVGAIGTQLSTDAGYSYKEQSDVVSAVSALRRHLAKVSDFAIAVLAAMLRRHDADHDGLIDAYDVRAALRDTILTCAPAAAGGGAGGAGGVSGSGLPGGRARVGGATPVSADTHPLMVSDADSDTVFAAVVRKLEPAAARSSRPVVSLEAFHALLRGSLSDRRLATVTNLFNSLDTENTGAIPVGQVMLAFRAEEHPAVAAARVAAPAVYRQFQDSFGEGFALLDKFGPISRRTPGPAADAYYGLGDGQVRLPFFQAWHEAVSACHEDDGAFNLVVFHIWSGGASGGARRGGGRAGPSAAAAHFDPRSMLAKAEDSSDSMVSNMQRMMVGKQAVVRGSGGVTASGISGSVPGFGGSGGGGASSSPRQDRERQTMSGLVPGPASAATQSAVRGAGLASFAADASGSAATSVGNSSSGFFSSDMGVVRDGTGSRFLTSPHRNRAPPPAADAHLEAALSSIRSVMLKRGPKSFFQLLHSLEAAAGAVAGQPGTPAPLTHVPMPARTFQAVLLDNSFSLPDRLQQTLVRALSDPRSGGAAVDAAEFVERLRGPLPAGRLDAVMRAYDHVARSASASLGQPIAPTAMPPPPLLDDVRMMYRSVHHPDVRSGRRSEEEVLREFLECFDGPTVVDGSDGTVSGNGFADFYAILSMFVPEDSHFIKTVYDCWALHQAAAHAHAPDAPAAGRAVQYPGPTPANAPTVYDSAAARRASGVGGLPGMGEGYAPGMRGLRPGAGGAAEAPSHNPLSSHAAHAPHSSVASALSGGHHSAGGHVGGPNAHKRGWGIERLGWG